MFKKILRIKFALVTTILILLISGINFAIVYLFVPGSLKEEKTIIIKSKLSIEQMTSILYENKIIKLPALFTILAKIYSLKHLLKSGEYTFTQNISPIQTLRILAHGKSIVHKLIIPEGVMVSEIIKKINDEERLMGEILGAVPEGFLMPSTYYYSYGDQKEQIINKMRKLMTAAIDKAVQKLPTDSPLKTRLDVLILASIVEKETNLDSEKPLVAAVFLNRLKKQMKLQADPTTIYAITLGQGKLGRMLTKRDLALPSPYNTYYVFNLPPGAISCPGAKSIESVVNPANVDFLYFVVNSNGGHNFASNISEHNKNVDSYRNSVNNIKK
ncbi:endolytic transglycosylase MltG [Candidatus Tisiphia endosymbiont of Nemotelus uliginosus]|uniref:endolytic transglycosylase MltG n=1 Tax=Candidatus Tisiphia endosymbiont of Nemotelus uliginosus TaxID=3077926 RepID=UPI0035C8D20C